MRSKNPDERKYYVYEWFIVDTGEVFYVGKGTRERYKTRKRENKFFMRMVSTHKCSSRIVKDNLTEKEALEHEAGMIALYRAIPGNRLTNVQDGGESPPTFYGEQSPTKRPEVRAKIKTALRMRYDKNPELREAVSVRMREFCNSEKGKVVVSKRSHSVMARKEVREKISNANKRYFTDDRRKETSLKMKELYSKPDMREKVTGANNGASRRVSQYTTDGKHVADYECLADAEKQTGVSFKNISKAVRGHNKTAGGYVWRFADEKDIHYKPRVYTRPPERKKRAVMKFAKDGTFLEEYESITEAVAANGFKDHSNISICLAGRTKTAYGYIWKYKDTQGNTVPSPEQGKV